MAFVHVEIDRKSALIRSVRVRVVSSFVAIFVGPGWFFACVTFHTVRRLYITKKTGALVGMMSFNAVAVGLKGRGQTASKHATACG